MRERKKGKRGGSVAPQPSRDSGTESGYQQRTRPGRDGQRTVLPSDRDKSPRGGEQQPAGSASGRSSGRVEDDRNRGQGRSTGQNRNNNRGGAPAGPARPPDPRANQSRPTPARADARPEPTLRLPEDPTERFLFLLRDQRTPIADIIAYRTGQRDLPRLQAPKPYREISELDSQRPGIITEVDHIISERIRVYIGLPKDSNITLDFPKARALDHRRPSLVVQPRVGDKECSAFIIVGERGRQGGPAGEDDRVIGIWSREVPAERNRFYEDATAAAVSELITRPLPDVIRIFHQDASAPQLSLTVPIATLLDRPQSRTAIEKTVVEKVREYVGAPVDVEITISEIQPEELNKLTCEITARTGDPAADATTTVTVTGDESVDVAEHDLSQAHDRIRAIEQAVQQRKDRDAAAESARQNAEENAQRKNARTAFKEAVQRMNFPQIVAFLKGAIPSEVAKLPSFPLLQREADYAEFTRETCIAKIRRENGLELKELTLAPDALQTAVTDPQLALTYQDPDTGNQERVVLAGDIEANTAALRPVLEAEKTAQHNRARRNVDQLFSHLPLTVDLIRYIRGDATVLNTGEEQLAHQRILARDPALGAYVQEKIQQQVRRYLGVEAYPQISVHILPEQNVSDKGTLRLGITSSTGWKYLDNHPKQQTITGTHNDRGEVIKLIENIRGELAHANEREQALVTPRIGLESEIIDPAAAARILGVAVAPEDRYFRIEVDVAAGGREQTVLVVNRKRHPIDDEQFKALQKAEALIDPPRRVPPEVAKGATESVRIFSESYHVNPPVHVNDEFIFREGDTRQPLSFVEGQRFILTNFTEGRPPEKAHVICWSYPPQQRTPDQIRGAVYPGIDNDRFLAEDFARLLTPNPHARLERVAAVGSVDWYKGVIAEKQTVDGRALLLALNLPTSEVTEGNEKRMVTRCRWVGESVPPLRWGMMVRVSDVDAERQAAVIEIENPNGSVSGTRVGITYADLIAHRSELLASDAEPTVNWDSPSDPYYSALAQAFSDVSITEAPFAVFSNPRGNFYYSDPEIHLTVFMAGPQTPSAVKFYFSGSGEVRTRSLVDFLAGIRNGTLAVDFNRTSARLAAAASTPVPASGPPSELTIIRLQPAQDARESAIGPRDSLRYLKHAMKHLQGVKDNMIQRAVYSVPRPQKEAAQPWLEQQVGTLLTTFDSSIAAIEVTKDKLLVLGADRDGSLLEQFRALAAQEKNLALEPQTALRKLLDDFDMTKLDEMKKQYDTTATALGDKINDLLNQYNNLVSPAQTIYDNRLQMLAAADPAGGRGPQPGTTDASSKPERVVRVAPPPQKGVQGFLAWTRRLFSRGKPGGPGVHASERRKTGLWSVNLLGRSGRDRQPLSRVSEETLQDFWNDLDTKLAAVYGISPEEMASETNGVGLRDMQRGMTFRFATHGGRWVELQYDDTSTAWYTVDQIVDRARRGILERVHTPSNPPRSRAVDFPPAVPPIVRDDVKPADDSEGDLSTLPQVAAAEIPPVTPERRPEGDGGFTDAWRAALPDVDANIVDELEQVYHILPQDYAHRIVHLSGARFDVMLIANGRVEVSTRGTGFDRLGIRSPKLPVHEFLDTILRGARARRYMHEREFNPDSVTPSAQPTIADSGDPQNKTKK